MNRGRFQAQGNSLEESEPWATENEITKDNGDEKISALKGKLSRRELNARNNAFRRATDFVQSSPNTGHYAQIIKTFSDSPKNREIRVDIEIREGRAFIDNTNEG